jgi:hypothetical protein
MGDRRAQAARPRLYPWSGHCSVSVWSIGLIKTDQVPNNYGRFTGLI